MTVSKAGGWLAAIVLLVIAIGAAALKGLRAKGVSLAILPRGADALGAILSLGAGGWAAFAGLQIIVSVSGILPASALGIAAGSIYGIGVGFALSAIGSLAGAAVAFGLSRSVFRPCIERLMQNRPRLRRVDAAIQREGWRLACLIRLSPVMPFAATSYMLGLSSISLRDYCIGTLGSMPALFGYVAVGALAGAGVHAWNSGEGLFRLGLLAAGLVATGLATWRIKQSFGSVVGAPGEHLDITEINATSAAQSAMH